MKAFVLRALPDGAIQACIERWTERGANYGDVGALVDARKLCEQFVADLVQIRAAQESDAVSLDEAALLGGYNRDSLARLVRHGKLENVGTARQPRIRRSSVPIRPGYSGRSDNSPLVGVDPAPVSSLTLEAVGSRTRTYRTRR